MFFIQMLLLLSGLTLSTTTDNTTKTNLTVHVIANYGGDILPMGNLVTEGTQMALEVATNRLNLTRNYAISFELHDDMCLEAVDVSIAAQVLESMASEANMVPLLLGPACMGNSIVGAIVKHYNVVGMTEGSINLKIFIDRQMYESYFALRPSYEIFFEAIPAFIQSNGWSRVFLISDTETFSNPLEEILSRELAKRKISLAGTVKVYQPETEMPEPEHFEMAVQDLASMPDPIIIIIMTHSYALLPCHLYLNGFHGPQFVFLFPMYNAFLPNTLFRLPGCSDEMIFEMLRSIIFYAYAEPLNMHDEVVDEVGNRKSYFEREMRRRIGGHAELQENWVFWRGAFYNQALVSLIVLDKVETALQLRNDSLSNWITKGNNFQKNGSYISSLIRDELKHLKVKGMTINEDEPPNSRKGRTAFFQVQLTISEVEVKKVRREDLPSIIKFVAVSTYDSAKENATIQQGPGKLLWRGPNVDQAPFDSLQIFAVKDALVPGTTAAVLQSLASVLIAVNLAFILATNYYKKALRKIANSQPSLNTLILAGNTFVSVGILAIPWVGSNSSHVNCMTAALLLLIGFQLIASSISGKLEAASLLVKWNSTYVIRSRHSRQTVVNTVRNFIRNFAVAIVALETTVQAFIMALWFGLYPLSTSSFDRTVQGPEDGNSIAYRHFALSCGMPPTSIDFIAANMVCYLIVMLRSLFLTISLRRVVLKTISDLSHARMAWAAIAILDIAGGCVIGAFFKDGDPSTLLIAIAVMGLASVYLNIAIIFLPKARQISRTLLRGRNTIRPHDRNSALFHTTHRV